MPRPLPQSPMMMPVSLAQLTSTLLPSGLSQLVDAVSDELGHTQPKPDPLELPPSRSSITMSVSDSGAPTPTVQTLPSVLSMPLAQQQFLSQVKLWPQSSMMPFQSQFTNQSIMQAMPMLMQQQQNTQNGRDMFFAPSMGGMDLNMYPMMSQMGQMGQQDMMFRFQQSVPMSMQPMMDPNSLNMVNGGLKRQPSPDLDGEKAAKRAKTELDNH